MKKSFIHISIKWGLKVILCLFAFLTIILIILKWVNPPTTTVILSEKLSFEGKISQEWKTIDNLGENIILSVIASEDSNFCNHFGFDFSEIFKAKSNNFSRGASTISQQVSKNIFLWRGRSWVRKGIEAIITVMIEIIWSKQRILEVYLNIVETGNGFIGIQAISNKRFKKNASQLTLNEASYIAVTLPNPKKRNAKKLTKNLQKRAKKVRVGASTLRMEGRAFCVLGT